MAQLTREILEAYAYHVVSFEKISGEAEFSPPADLPRTQASAAVIQHPRVTKKIGKTIATHSRRAAVTRAPMESGNHPPMALSLSSASQRKAASGLTELSEMSPQYRKLRIFVASPGDVESERKQLADVVAELNLTMSAIAPEKNCILELVRWETHVHPGLGRDAQDVVNEQIGPYDIFIGILWKRMGTPTRVARSGTEEEIRRAYAAWRENKALPVLIYFCQQPSSPPQTKDEAEQISKVEAFRAELSNIGLISYYKDHNGFADVVRPHLLMVLGKLLSPPMVTVKGVESYAGNAPHSKNTAAREQVATYVQEYQNLRATMEPGESRTRKMEAIFSKMRTLALPCYAFLPDLAHSGSAGDRLMAVAILLSAPSAEYISWLAQRIQLDAPLVGYHSSEALLAAARVLHGSHDEQLRDALATGKKSLEERIAKREARRDSRYLVLDQAERELRHLISRAAEK
jgi:hypothetical protein